MLKFFIYTTGYVYPITYTDKRIALERARKLAAIDPNNRKWSVGWYLDPEA